MPGEGIWLTIMLYGLMILPYMACGMIVVLIAIASDNMSVTLVFSIGLLTVAQYLSAFEQIKPFSIVNQMYFFHEYFKKNLNWDMAIQSIIVIVIYMIVFYFLSVQTMKKKDLVL